MFSWCEKRLYQITITYSPRLTPPSCKHRVRAPPTLNLIMINTRVLFPCQTQNYTHQARILRCPDAYTTGSNSDFLSFAIQQKLNVFTIIQPLCRQTSNVLAVIVIYNQLYDWNVNFKWQKTKAVVRWQTIFMYEKLNFGFIIY